MILIILFSETAQFKMEEYEKEVKDEKDKIEANLKKKEVQVLVNQFFLLYLSYLVN